MGVQRTAFCKWCGEEFHYEHNSGPIRKYCSNSHRAEFSRYQRRKPCLICGKKFYPWRPHSDYGIVYPYGRVCSLICHNVYKKRLEESMRGLNRQRRWQIKMKLEERCVICGEPSVNSQHCEVHREAHREQAQTYLSKHKTTKGS